MLSIKKLIAKFNKSKTFFRYGLFTSLFVIVFSLLFLYFSIQAKADSGRFLIDFGRLQNSTNATGWNNITDTQATDTTTVIPLMDSAGTTTDVTFQFTDGFNCLLPGELPVNVAGTQLSSLYPPSATVDSFYLGTTAGGVCKQDDTTASFILRNLDQNATYDIKFYASRMDTAATPSARIADYTIGSTTVSLNAANNINGVAVISDVTPIDGTITAIIEKNSASASFGYLGVVEVIKIISTDAPTADAGDDHAITLPTHEIALSGNGTDTDGTIASYSWTEVSSGAATITNPTNQSTTVTDLAAGTYTFRLTVTDDQGATGTDDVTVVVSSHDFSACPVSKIVVLGSSTAAGTGATPISNSWANKFTAYLQQLNTSNSVVNLAVGGYTTYDIMPTGTTPPAGRPNPNTTRNITAAIAQNPDAIIVNLPSGDIAAGYSVGEIQANYQTITAAAAQAGIPIWIATKQPRTLSLDQTGRENQMLLRDWILTTFAPTTFDFWTTIANADGTINAPYDYDGVHLNNLGHQKLYSRVVGSNLIASLCVEPTATPTLTPTNTPTPTVTPTPTNIPTPTPIYIKATEDTFVTSLSPSSEAGGKSTKLHVKYSPKKIIYIKFNLAPLAGKTIKSIELRLNASDLYSPSSKPTVRLVGNSVWTEANMNYSNRKPLGSILGYVSSPAKNSWTYTNLTNITNALITMPRTFVTIALELTSGSAEFNFSSDESAAPPILIIK